MGFPPEPQDLRARQIGHVLVNSNVARPCSQYFCCMVAAHRPFVQQHPVATKRALRAILKGTDLCAMEPGRASQLLVDRARTPREDLLRQVLQDIRYDRWRDYDPEDTVRFYALRLHEVGMIQSIPRRSSPRAPTGALSTSSSGSYKDRRPSRLGRSAWLVEPSSP
jgi:NitT/TauT family transport system substrate-binding protein